MPILQPKYFIFHPIWEIYPCYKAYMYRIHWGWHSISLWCFSWKEEKKEDEEEEEDMEAKYEEEEEDNMEAKYEEEDEKLWVT